MQTYFISRHAGALAWARETLPGAILLDSLDPERIQPGDKVCGILPVDLAAQVCARGARFFALVFDREDWTRGTEMTANEMQRRGAYFVEFVVSRPEGS
jgi:CRISPR-associated protein Csx16